MEDLSLHILDIAENSIEAHADKIEIKIKENRRKDLLSMEIRDNGKGMDKETVRKALDPFFTTKKTRRFGLGLSLLAEAVKAANGHFSIQSKPGQGTQIQATFQASHIDTKPLGDIVQTLITLIMAHPEINIHYRHQVDRDLYSLDTEEIKAQLNGISITSPEVIKFIRNNLKEGIANIRRQK
jgi:anti-sigma regulatory factor (Ser/Thr protein kinase)